MKIAMQVSKLFEDILVEDLIEENSKDDWTYDWIDIIGNILLLKIVNVVIYLLTNHGKQKDSAYQKLQENL